MGKTVEGASLVRRKISLDDYKFYQYWRNVDDADVSKIFKIIH